MVRLSYLHFAAMTDSEYLISQAILSLKNVRFSFIKEKEIRTDAPGGKVACGESLSVTQAVSHSIFQKPPRIMCDTLAIAGMRLALSPAPGLFILLTCVAPHRLCHKFFRVLFPQYCKPLISSFEEEPNDL